jgi:hypothetical protein
MNLLFNGMHAESVHTKSHVTVFDTNLQWLIDQVLDMIDQVRKGYQKHFLYYETATGPPVGSGAISSIMHSEGMKFFSLPENTVTLCAGFIYPHQRSKNYANISHSHR